MLEIILWIIGITSFTFCGAWYARRFEKPDALIALYVVFVALSQIIATKVAKFDLGLAIVTAPAAVLVYSVTYLFTDIVNEKFGRREVHKMILIAFVTQVAMVFFLWIGTRLPPAPFWENQQACEDILGLVPRITLASWIAFLVSENFDAWVFDVFKRITKGRHLWMRNAFSSVPALTVDTFLFISIAFLGVMPWAELIKGQLATKWLVGLVNIPFMYFNRWVMFGFSKDGQ
ncbi:MAG TPA: queuosine precursor transporter [Dehalococcoidia bacterium]|nr:queuosine precursor transporter [Dehalococcoidia bacterium]